MNENNEKNNDPIEFLNTAIDDYMARVVPEDAGDIQYLETKTAFIAGMYACMASLTLIKNQDDVKRIDDLIEKKMTEMVSLRR